MFQNKLIKAGAGTGKTYLLARAYINRLVGFTLFPLENIDKKTDLSLNSLRLEEIKKVSSSVREILTITYTVAAAEEMKSRILELIIHLLEYMNSYIKKSTKSSSKDLTIPSSLQNDQDAIRIIEKIYETNPKIFNLWREALSDAVTQTESIKISTIHSYANSLILSNLDILGIDPPRIITGKQMQEMISLVSQKIIESMDKENYFHFFEVLGEYHGNNLISEYISNGETRRYLRETKKHLQNNESSLLNSFLCKKILASRYWPILYNIMIFMNDLKKEFSDSKIKIELEKTFMDFKNFWEGDLLQISSFSNVDFRKKPWKNIDDLYKEKLKAFKKLDIWSKLDCSYLTQSDETKKIWNKLNQSYLLIIQFLENYYKLYIREMENHNFIDYDQMIEYAERISSHNRNKNTFRHIMIDEFQDTSRLQWNFLKLIIGLDGKLFVVGDHKQAIYSFQGGDPRIIQNLKYQSHDMEILSLVKNYRSSKMIIQFYNALFSSMNDSQYPDLYKIPYFQKVLPSPKYIQSYEKVYPSEKNKETSSISFFFSFYNKEEIKKSDIMDLKKIRENHYQGLASFILKIKEGQIAHYRKISEKLQRNEKAIGILMMNTSDASLLSEYLRDNGIKVTSTRSNNLFLSEEAREFFFFLKTWHIIHLNLNDKNETDLYTSKSFTEIEKYYITGFLSSHYVGLTDVQVWDIINNLKEDSLEKEKAFNSIFKIYESREISAILNSINLASSIPMILELFHIYSILSEYHDFTERWKNLDNLIKYARNFTSQYGSNIERFLEEMEFYIFNPDAESESFINKENDSSPIEIGSIHSSKGLEYPMVIIPQLEKTFDQQGGLGSLYTEIFQSSPHQSDDIYLTGFHLEDFEKDFENPYKKMASTLNLEQKASEYLRQFYVAVTRAENHLIFSGIFSDDYLKNNSDLFSDHLFKSDNSFASYFKRNSDLFDASSVNSWKDKNTITVYNEKNSETLKAFFWERKDFLKNDPKKHYYSRSTINLNTSYQNYDKKKDKNLSLHPFSIFSGFSYHEAWDQKQLGTLFHRFIALHFDELENNRNQLIHSYQKNFQLNKRETEFLKSQIEKWISHNLYPKIKLSTEKYFELPLEITDEDNRRKKLFIDLLFFDNDSEIFYLIDFKTSSVKNEKDAIKKTFEYKYDIQLQTYENALRKLNFTDPIKKGIYYTDIAYLHYLE